jgi:hypothetical protein
MFNKKGLSEVVSNVLIILVVIGAVALIAGVVINIVQTGTESTASASACLTTKFEVISCDGTTVVVKRLTGGTSDGVRFQVYSDAADIPPQGGVIGGLNQLSTESISMGNVAGTKVNVAAQLESGELCPSIFQEVTCA